MKKFKNILPAALLMVAGVVSTGCTKADYGDDFMKGDAPPVAGGYTNSREVASANLVGYWGFNGSLVDSISGTVGTGSGNKYSAGLKGLAFQGSDNAYATATPSNAIKTMTSYTVSLWVNTAQNAAATGLVSLGDAQNFWGNINIFFENGGTATLARFKTIFEDNGTVYDNGIQDVQNGFGKWTQYIITYDGAGSFKSYVNGTLAATKTITGGAIRFTNVGPIVFGTLHFMTNPSSTTGSTAQGWAGYLSGKLDEVRIYNKALTATEITALAILEKQGR